MRISMKKGEIYEGIIEKVDYPNRGYMTAEETRVLVKNAIPGQKIRCRILKKKNGRAEGQLMEVLNPSPLEKRPPLCSIFPEDRKSVV